jgi:thymidylate synthase (FAD)
LNECKLVALTTPRVEGVNSAEEFIAYAARVSNPANQNNSETAAKLVRYLMKNNHWSPFEMVSMTLEIRTTRDIARQILRHRSFSFQEFSQRYAEATEFVTREARLQDTKNRQNSIEIRDDSRDIAIVQEWEQNQKNILELVQLIYTNALKKGVAKEQARSILPEGCTVSTLYMAGTLRSWIHYCGLRMANGTQKEHMEVAKSAWQIIEAEFPSIAEAVHGL